MESVLHNNNRYLLIGQFVDTDAAARSVVSNFSAAHNAVRRPR